MDFKSHGTTTDTCRLRLNFDQAVDFTSASIAPDIVTGTYIEWLFPPGTTPDWYCMEMTFYLDPNTSAGTTLVWTGTYTAGANTTHAARTLSVSARAKDTSKNTSAVLSLGTFSVKGR